MSSNMYYPNLINGHFVESDQKITIISPNNLQPVGKVNSLSPDVINDAFQAARTSQQA